MLYIFAKDGREAANFARQKGIRPCNYRYVSSYRALAGLSGSDHSYIKLPGYLQRKDTDKLQNIINIQKVCFGFTDIGEE